MENIILLHGALGSKEELYELATKLEKNYKVHCFDLEGHGQNAGENNFSMQVFSENISNYMKQKQMENSHFFGYSMGGYAAMFFAKGHPERLGKIICLGTKLEWNPEIAGKEVRSLDPDKIQEKVPHFAEALAKKHKNWEGVVKKTASMMLGLGRGNGLSQTDFKNIENEVLLIRGEEDKMVSIEETRVVADLIPNGSWKNLKGAPHAIAKVDADRLAEFIREFIGK